MVASERIDHCAPNCSGVHAEVDPWWLCGFFYGVLPPSLYLIHTSVSYACLLYSYFCVVDQ